MSRRRKQRKGEGLPRKKPAAWQGWLLRGSLFALGLLVFLVVGGYFWVKSYLRSDEFRDELSRQVGYAAGGPAEFGPLAWQGSRVETPTFSVEGKKVGSLQVEHLGARVDLGGLWSRTWLIPEIEISSAESHWDLRKGQETSSSEGSASRGGSAASAGKKSGGGFLPNRTEVRALRVNDYEGEILVEDGSYRWERMRVEYAPGTSQDEGEFTLRRGRVETPLDWLGRLKLGEAELRARAGRVNLLASDWTLMERGLLELSGHWEEGSWLLEGEVEELTLEELLPVDWKRKVSGRLEGDFVVEQATGDGLVVDGSVEIVDGVVGSLPFLNRLAAYAGTSSLQRLTFEEARADFRWEPTGWRIDELVLSDDGLLRLEGRLKVEGDSLDGVFRVGVPPGLLAHIPGAEEKVFLPGERGLLWTPMRVTGTWQSPQEDLSGRMIQAAGERMFEMIPETGQWALKFGGQAMDQSTALLLENQGVILAEGQKAAEELLEQGSDVVEEGVKTGFELLDGLLGQ